MEVERKVKFSPDNTKFNLSVESFTWKLIISLGSWMSHFKVESFTCILKVSLEGYKFTWKLKIFLRVKSFQSKLKASLAS